MAKKIIADPGTEQWIGLAQVMARKAEAMRVRSGQARVTRAADTGDGTSIIVSATKQGHTARIAGGGAYVPDNPYMDIWDYYAALFPTSQTQAFYPPQSFFDNPPPGMASYWPNVAAGPVTRVAHTAKKLLNSDGSYVTKHSLVIGRFMKRVAQFDWDEVATLKFPGQVSANPTLNITGAYVDHGDRGDIVYLPGTLGPIFFQTVVREMTTDQEAEARAFWGWGVLTDQPPFNWLTMYGAEVRVRDTTHNDDGTVNIVDRRMPITPSLGKIAALNPWGVFTITDLSAGLATDTEFAWDGSAGAIHTPLYIDPSPGAFAANQVIFGAAAQALVSQVAKMYDQVAREDLTILKPWASAQPSKTKSVIVGLPRSAVTVLVRGYNAQFSSYTGVDYPMALSTSANASWLFANPYNSANELYQHSIEMLSNAALTDGRYIGTVELTEYTYDAKADTWTAKAAPPTLNNVYYSRATAAPAVWGSPQHIPRVAFYNIAGGGATAATAYATALNLGPKDNVDSDMRTLCVGQATLGLYQKSLLQMLLGKSKFVPIPSPADNTPGKEYRKTAHTQVNGTLVFTQPPIT